MIGQKYDHDLHQTANRFVINSDNMKVIDTMNNGGHSIGATTTVFDDCFFIVCDFPFTSFEHCNRKANKVAHELARLAKQFVTRDWIEEPMGNIVSLLVDDVTIISN